MFVIIASTSAWLWHGAFSGEPAGGMLDQAVVGVEMARWQFSAVAEYTDADTSRMHRFAAPIVKGGVSTGGFIDYIVEEFATLQDASAQMATTASAIMAACAGRPAVVVGPSGQRSNAEAMGASLNAGRSQAFCLRLWCWLQRRWLLCSRPGLAGFCIRWR